MSFSRITFNKQGRATLETVQLPEDVAPTAEAQAAVLLEEKERIRQQQFRALTPVPDISQPVQRPRKRAAQKEEE